jgi:hypothetical protein
VWRPACMGELRRGGALAQTAMSLTGVSVDDGGAAGGDLHRKEREVRQSATGARGSGRRRRLPRDGWQRLQTVLLERPAFKGMRRCRVWFSAWHQHAPRPPTGGSDFGLNGTNEWAHASVKSKFKTNPEFSFWHGKNS